MTVFKNGLKKISSDVERCLSLVRNYMNIPYHYDFMPNLTCAHFSVCRGTFAGRYQFSNKTIKTGKVRLSGVVYHCPVSDIPLVL